MSASTPEHLSPDPSNQLRFLLHELCTSNFTQELSMRTLFGRRIELHGLPHLPQEIVGDIPSALPAGIPPALLTTSTHFVAYENISPVSEEKSFNKLLALIEADPHFDEIFSIGSITLKDKVAYLAPGESDAITIRTSTDFTYHVGLDVGPCGEKTYPIGRSIARTTRTHFMPPLPPLEETAELQDILSVNKDELPPLNAYIASVLVHAETARFLSEP
ncbi:MAG TPA: hypothetical protein VLG11_06390 [Candidatus Saccharimonadales bacterium]|nr:hypothetical protein [Candidatus Saccharimonadales bacterium]